jgi:hypothetical protein
MSDGEVRMGDIVNVVKSVTVDQARS